MSISEDYAEFVRSLATVTERETRTQLVFAVSGASFCWVSKADGTVQLIPALGSGAARSRTLMRKGDLTLCVRCATGEVDAEYDDPRAVLKRVWSYVGFRPTDCSFEYGCTLIRQAHLLAGGHKDTGARKVSLKNRPIEFHITKQNKPSVPPFDEIKNRIEEMRDSIVRMGRKFGTPIEREDPAAMISRLEREKLIPGNVASMMHLVRTERNRIKYEGHVPSDSEWLVIQNAWSVIEEWWRCLAHSNANDR